MRPVPTLAESAWLLLNEALELYQDDYRATNRLRRQLNRFEQPLRIAVAGPGKSGKSTLINAVIGEEVAPVEVDDGTSVFTWYEDGPAPRAVGYSAGGSRQELVVTRSARGMRVDLGGWQPSGADEIVVTWPTRTLRHAILLDAPALDAPAPDGSGRKGSGGAPVPDDGGAPVLDRILRDADAVLYLTCDGRGTDLRALRSAQEGPVARAAPVNVIQVLSRADEIGGGRIDAFLTARQLARRQRRDPRVNSLCVSVVALGGLVASAGRVLTEAEFETLAALAEVPRVDLENALLSTDRFAGTELPAPVPATTRRALLDRLGIFGVRLATTLIRTGCGTRAKLAAELVRRSGLTELRESMARYFIDRRDVLKARSALMALENTLRDSPRPGSGKLVARLERAVATAHDFRELRLLAALQDAQLRLDTDSAAEAYRLVGGNGTSPAARLGVDHDAAVGELWTLGSVALRRWQDQAENPLLSLDRRRAARVVVRSCEGMLAQLSGHRR
jgi:hypothetical protein